MLEKRSVSDMQELLQISISKYFSLINHLIFFGDIKITVTEHTD